MKVLGTVQLRKRKEAESKVAEVLGVARMGVIRTEIIVVREIEARLKGFGHGWHQ